MENHYSLCVLSDLCGKIKNNITAEIAEYAEKYYFFLSVYLFLRNFALHRR